MSILDIIKNLKMDSTPLKNVYQKTDIKIYKSFFMNNVRDIIRQISFLIIV